MPRVFIDGIEYVPKASLEKSEATNEQAEAALMYLVELIHLYSTGGMSRGARGCLRNAIRELDPAVAEMDESEFGELYATRRSD